MLSEQLAGEGGRATRVHITVPQKGDKRELIDLAERSASAPVYPLLKRPDERHVTMQAYDNPAFVADIVRNVAGVEVPPPMLKPTPSRRATST